MSTPQPPRSPQSSLEELKKRLATAQEVVVSPDGKMHVPEDPKVAQTDPQSKTVLKPQRWFALFTRA
ncbi:hypothetical protein [Candidatus Chloroploca sp. Khr17]|uniref:hypothetical protein n=1 Tax=Candidatus Chloroploca sp. Khr17 TaxID=2496869 RepID=UPI00101C5244|nr:hypothetical protein [Candidatus Chloroploca sp. Khr17]